MKNIPNQICRIIDRTVRKIFQTTIWLALLMVIITAYNSFARYTGRFFAMQMSSNALLELQWYLFSIIFLLGLAYTLQVGSHVRVDVFYESFSEKKKMKINFWGNLLLLLPFSVTGVVTSIPSVYDSWKLWENSPDPSGLPRYPIKTMVFFGFLLLMLQCLSLLFQDYKSWNHTAGEQNEP